MKTLILCAALVGMAGCQKAAPPDSRTVFIKDNEITNTGTSAILPTVPLAQLQALNADLVRISHHMDIRNQVDEEYLRAISDVIAVGDAQTLAVLKPRLAKINSLNRQLIQLSKKPAKPPAPDSR